MGPKWYSDTPQSWSAEALRAMDWLEFEELCAKAFEANGYQAIREPESGGAGIFLELRSQQGSYAGVAFCRGNGPSGPAEAEDAERLAEFADIREKACGKAGFRHLISAAGVSGQALSACGRLGADAADAQKFAGWLREREDFGGALRLRVAGEWTRPSCPGCRAKLDWKQSKSGVAFWGCSGACLGKWPKPVSVWDNEADGPVPAGPMGREIHEDAARGPGGLQSGFIGAAPAQVGPGYFAAKPAPGKGLQAKTQQGALQGKAGWASGGQKVPLRGNAKAGAGQRGKKLAALAAVLLLVPAAVAGAMNASAIGEWIGQATKGSLTDPLAGKGAKKYARQAASEVYGKPECAAFKAKILEWGDSDRPAAEAIRLIVEQKDKARESGCAPKAAR